MMTDQPENFVMTLPELLQKHVSDREELNNVLKTAMDSDFSIYVNGRHDKHLENLLRCLEEIAEKHTDEEIVKRVSKVLANLCDQPAPFFQRCHTMRKRVLDSIVVNFKNNFRQMNDKDTADAAEHMAALLLSIEKVVSFLCFHDFDKWKVFLEGALASLAMPADEIIAKFGSEEGQRIKEKALKGYFLCIVWNITCITNGNPTQPIDVVCSRRDRFITASLTALNEGLGDTVLFNLCDFLILCNDKQPIEKMRYKVTDADILSINFFMQDNVFDQEKDESVVVDQEQTVLRVQRKRKLLAAYCKLFPYGVLPILQAAHVSRHYLELFEDFEDILKYLIDRCRYIDDLSFAKAVSTALQENFKKLHERCSGQIDMNNTDFMKIRELAKRLVLTFGSNAKKIRDPIFIMHKHGIGFVFNQSSGRRDVPPPYIAYLVIVMEFSSRMTPKNKKAFVTYLDAKVGEGFGGGEEWHSLLLYRNSLIQAEMNGLEANATKTGRKRSHQMEETLDGQGKEEG